MSSKKDLLKLLEEKKKRENLIEYEKDFSKFANDNLKIITKDAKKGFVNFDFNDCQKLITEIFSQRYLNLYHLV